MKTAVRIAPKRIQWIDSLKGFAMSLVILGHITQKYYKFDLYPTSTNEIGIIYQLIYSFHMPLFMMISGYLFSKAYINQIGDIKYDRLKVQFFNILIIYAFFSVMEGGVKIFFTKDVITPVEPIDLFLIFFKPIGGRMWYLYVLLEYYALFSRKIMRKIIGKWWLLGIMVVLSILSVFISSSWLFAIRYASKNILPFYVGLLMERYKENMLEKKSWMVILTFIVVTTRLVLYYQGNVSNEIPVVSVLYGVILAMWVFILFKKKIIFSHMRMLRIVGIYSMAMFVFHEYPLTVGTKILMKVITNAVVSVIMCFLLTIIIVLMVSYILKKMKLYDVFFFPYTKLFLKHKH